MSESSHQAHPSRERRLPFVITIVITISAVCAVAALIALRSIGSEEVESAAPANPTASSTPPMNDATDTDNDGLTAAQEQQYKTDPNLTDSDDDGFTDGEEVRGGYNPAGSGKLQNQ